MAQATRAGAIHAAGRRDFLTLLAGAGATVGAGAFAWPLLDSLRPAGGDDDRIATVDVDLSRLAPGQQTLARWGAWPVSIVRRPPATLLALQDSRLVRQLRDPYSRERQQAAYVENWHRSISPEFGVFVALCTRCGCGTRYTAPGSGPGLQGGFGCPCDASRFDLAGRVRRDAAAGYNLAVPPYLMREKLLLRLGVDPDDLAFDFDSVRRP